jgi:hypothetical protein
MREGFVVVIITLGLGLLVNFYTWLVMNKMPV